ncbi:MAG TPA: hypothetical protein VK891_04045 [Euzebyales bacterium]|nr:hypothetical protein [Euzebyales bacterium]
MASARRVAVDPCSLLTEREVEEALSVTIGATRLRSGDPLAQAFAFAPSDRVCEYSGVVPPPTAAPSDAVSRAPSEHASELRVDEALEELDGSLEQPDQGVASALRRADQIEAQVRTLELSVSVHPRPLDRAQFESFHQRRIRELQSRDGRRHDALAAAVVDQGSRFVDEATDRATDVGDIGDAARWYPALAQLHVLVGDVAFVVTSLKQSPMMAGLLFDTDVEPVYDPPPEFVELARIVAERLEATD